MNYMLKKNIPITPYIILNNINTDKLEKLTLYIDVKNNTNEKIDESKKPLNAPGKTEEEVYTKIKMPHWLEWEELSNDIKKLTNTYNKIIKFEI